MDVETYIFNDNLRHLLEYRGVFTDRWSMSNIRIKNGQKIVVPSDVKLEPYIGVYVGNTFCTMGAFSFSGSKLYTNYKIGRYCSLGHNISLIGGRHPYERISSSTFTYQNPVGPGFKKAILDLSDDNVHHFVPKEKDHLGDAPICMGHDVWIGDDVLLKPGIKIGQGSVIAQRSVVTHDVPPFSIWGGVPAKLIKMRFSDDVIERIMQSEWWDYAFPHFSSLNTLDPIEFCDGLEELKANGLKKFEPEPITFNDFVVCDEYNTRFVERISKARQLSEQHKILRRFIKLMVDKRRYKRLKTDPERFFADSKSRFIRFLQRYYN